MTTAGTLLHDAETPVRARPARDLRRHDMRAFEVAVPDADLIAAVRRGDADAYGTLYRRHVADVRRLAGQLSRHSSEADDVTSDVFASTLRAIRNGYGPDDDARPYLLRSVRHALASMRRNGDSGRARPADDPTEFEGLVGVDAATDEPPDDDLSDAFRQLPDRFRSVLWLTEVEGASPADVAARGAAGDGVSAGAVASLTHRARCALRRQYLTSAMRRRRCTSRSCRGIRDVMPGVVLGDAAPLTTRRVDDHVAGCVECCAVFDDMSALAESMSSKSLFGLVLAVVGSATASVATLTGASCALPVVFATALSVTMLAGDNHPAQAAPDQREMSDTDQLQHRSPLTLDVPRRQVDAPVEAETGHGDAALAVPVRAVPVTTTRPDASTTPPDRGTAGHEPRSTAVTPPTTIDGATAEAEPEQPADDAEPGSNDTADESAPAAPAAPGPIDDIVEDGTAESTTEGLRSVTEPVAGVVDGVTQPIDEVLGGVTEPLAQTVDKVTEPVDELVTKTLEPAVDGVVAPAVAPVVKIVDDATTGVVDEVVEPAGEITNAVIAPVDNVLAEVTEPVANLTDGLESNTVNSIVGLVSGTSGGDTSESDTSGGGLLGGLLG